MRKKERRREVKMMYTEGTYLSSEQGEMRDVLLGSKVHTREGREGNIGLRAFCVVLKMVVLALGLCATVQKVQKGKGPC